MKFVLLLLAGLTLTGCAGRKYASFRDEYEAARVDQLTGNNVSSRALQRTILCLNARREIRARHGFTNVTVQYVTNATVVQLTNQTITVTTNQSRTLATNTIALPSSPLPGAPEELVVAETNQLLLAATPPQTTNVAVTTTHNLTLTQAGNQLSTLANSQTQINRQVTVATNHLSLTTAENLLLVTETNQLVTTQTNLTLMPVTNVVVVAQHQPARDYYLFTELTPPPDFTLQPGESLVLLVDGTRHAFAPQPAAASHTGRKGFATTFYAVPPEVLVRIANAREVHVRVKGVHSVIDREMSDASRRAFRKFLLKYFVPEEPNPPTAGAVAQAKRE